MKNRNCLGNIFSFLNHRQTDSQTTTTTTTTKTTKSPSLLGWCSLAHICVIRSMALSSSFIHFTFQNYCRTDRVMDGKRWLEKTGRAERWADGRTNRRSDRRDGKLNGWMEEQMDGRTDGRPRLLI